MDLNEDTAREMINLVRFVVSLIFIIIVISTDKIDDTLIYGLAIGILFPVGKTIIPYSGLSDEAKKLLGGKKT